VKKKLIAAAAAVAVTATTLGVAGSASATGTAPTLGDILTSDAGALLDYDTNDNDFDVIVNAVVALDAANPGGVEFVNTLFDRNASLTAFVPTDGAFKRLVKEFAGADVTEDQVVATLVGALGAPTIENVVLYHLTGGRVGVLDVVAKILKRQSVDTLLTGASFRPELKLFPFRIELRDNEPDLRNPRILQVNVGGQAANGLAHSIDRVLIPVNL
jgi:uncharacterized surface protein with fasciclin (FAS1) repeats